MSMLELIVTAVFCLSATNTVFVTWLYRTRADRAYVEKEFEKLHKQIANIK